MEGKQSSRHEGDDSDLARWSPQLPASGVYRLTVWFLECFSVHSSISFISVLESHTYKNTNVSQWHLSIFILLVRAQYYIKALILKRYCFYSDSPFIKICMADTSHNASLLINKTSDNHSYGEAFCKQMLIWHLGKESPVPALWNSH